MPVVRMSINIYIYIYIYIYVCVHAYHVCIILYNMYSIYNSYMWPRHDIGATQAIHLPLLLRAACFHPGRVSLPGFASESPAELGNLVPIFPLGLMVLMFFSWRYPLVN